MERKAVRACDIPEPDRSHFIPWSLAMIYAVEPSLETIYRRAFDQALINRHKRSRKMFAVRDAYVMAKNSADKLIGWNARDPRLRNRGAWEFYFAELLAELGKEFPNDQT